MLKVLGTLYGNTKEDFDTLLKPLTDLGFVPGYNTETSAMIMKDVVSLTEDENESEDQES